ncbi:hypothetical protein [Streptomyces crystallinus]|uniref:Uncharacterized protein n=1 Tax=Streptomyces crystallinus TaxID=68191 RepID=A0ABP3RPX5_9ACTN
MAELEVGDVQVSEFAHGAAGGGDQGGQRRGADGGGRVRPGGTLHGESCDELVGFVGVEVFAAGVGRDFQAPGLEFLGEGLG